MLAVLRIGILQSFRACRGCGGTSLALLRTLELSPQRIHGRLREALDDRSATLARGAEIHPPPGVILVTPRDVRRTAVAQSRVGMAQFDHVPPLRLTHRFG